MRRPILILVAIAAMAVVGLTLARLHGGDGQAIAVVEDIPAPMRSPEPPIVVDVAGAVARPGVYRLAAELEALPGIGPTTAARIVRSRGGHPFTRIEELQTRGLVTARVFADIKDAITTR